MMILLRGDPSRHVTIEMIATFRNMPETSSGHVDPPVYNFIVTENSRNSYLYGHCHTSYGEKSQSSPIPR